MAGVILLLGMMLAALWGRVSSLYISLETCSMVLFTVSYFFGAQLSENNMERFFSSVGAVGIPITLLVVITRSGSYFGYSGGVFTLAAFVCGGIIFALALLSNHSGGPLRAALGANFLPVFFGAASFDRLRIYFRDMGGFTLSFHDKLCFDGVLFFIFAIGVLIGANRSKLFSWNNLLAILIWVGVFAALLGFASYFDTPLMPIVFH